MNLLWLSVDNTSSSRRHEGMRPLTLFTESWQTFWQHVVDSLARSLQNKCLCARFQIIPHGEVNFSPTMTQGDSPRRMSYDDHIRAQFKILTGNGAINYVALNSNEPIW